MKPALFLVALGAFLLMSVIAGGVVHSADYLRQISASLAVLASPPSK